MKLPLKGTASNVDTNGDSVADAVRAVASGLPQVPWSSAAFNVTSKLVTNPANGCPAATASTRLDGWSGGAATLTNGWFSAPTPCTPDTSITSGPSGPVASTSASFRFQLDDFRIELRVPARRRCIRRPAQRRRTTPAWPRATTASASSAVAAGVTDPTPACQTFKVGHAHPDGHRQLPARLRHRVLFMVRRRAEHNSHLLRSTARRSNPCPNPVAVTGSGAHTLQFTADRPGRQRRHVDTTIVLSRRRRRRS